MTQIELDRSTLIRISYLSLIRQLENNIMPTKEEIEFHLAICNSTESSRPLQVCDSLKRPKPY